MPQVVLEWHRDDARNIYPMHYMNYRNDINDKH